MLEIEYDLNIKEGVYPIIEDIEDRLVKLIDGIEKYDGIILYSDKLKTGQKIKNGLYKGGKHINVGAALLKKEYTLKDMEREDLEIYYLNPQLYYTDNIENYQYGTSETIKTKLSFFWFILTVFLSFVIISIIISGFPRNRYYHVKDKRIIIDSSII